MPLNYKKHEVITSEFYAFKCPYMKKKTHFVENNVAHT